MDDDNDEERAEQVRGALVKVLGLLVVVALLIWLGATAMVHALGLNDDGDRPVGAVPAPSRSLPTTALPVPGQKSKSATPTPSKSASPSATDKHGGDIELEVSPVTVGPNERINLTGTYQGADNVSLEVQRFDNGTWTNFGVQATVRVGTFGTYILTSRSGETHLRVYDPQAKKGSNVVMVTVT